LVSVKSDDRLDPTVTLPKDALPGLRASCPLVVPAVPVPDRSRVVTESLAVLEMETEPLKVPAVFGVKTMLSGRLCPAAMVTGRLSALRVKTLVEMETLLMVTAAEPEFFAVVETVLLLPAVTLPKVRDGFVREIVPLCV